MKGRVMKSTGSWYEIDGDDGVMYNSRVRGKLRLEGIKETNPVAVGDIVEFDILNNEGAITAIVPRSNHILRQSVKKKGHAHVLAANVDQVAVIATLAFPRTSLGFIDRVLVSAEAFRIPQMILFNKQDLLDKNEQAKVRELESVYQNIGVKCMRISALSDDLVDIRALLKDKVTLFAGHSGVGKSTLLNRLSPDVTQRVGDVSDFTEKGTHTTTFAEMFRVDSNSYIIDTPGIKEWGIADMEQEEISDYFPEMRERRQDCKFGARCLHLNEPKCAVIDDVQNNRIALSRYESYVSIVLGEDNRK